MRAFAFILIALAVSFPAHAQQAAEPYVWYDEGTKHELHLVAGVVAEFGRGPSSQGGQQKLSQGSVLVETPSLRVYKRSPAAQQKSATAEFSNAQSPVFRDGAGSGAMRALPGGVIVTFKESYDEGAMREWATSNGLELDRKLPVTTVSMALIKTAAGLPALNTANRIRSLAGVAAAVPNWWTEKSKLFRPFSGGKPMDLVKARVGRAETSRRFTDK